MKLFFLSIIERHPSAGYLGASVSTATGFWVLVDQITKLGALISIAIGIAVGIATWRVQRQQLAKLEAERRGRLE